MAAKGHVEALWQRMEAHEGEWSDGYDYATWFDIIGVCVRVKKNVCHIIIYRHLCKFNIKDQIIYFKKINYDEIIFF